jgi:acyl dehydratase
MAINYDELMATEYNDVPVSYQDQDVILYALGVGLGREFGNSRELAYVYERLGPHTLPSYASMLIPDDLLRDSGCNVERMLHRSQSIELFRPLPGSGEFLLNQKVVQLSDLGANKGADIEVESEIRRRKDDTVVCVLGSRMILREDGGFGGPPPAARKRHKIPNRDADMICDLPTRQDQALLFRLSGDRNPLHVDPSVAKGLGFESPILHGRCTYGIACHAILKTVCDYDFTLLKSFDVRFSAPVYPGDLIRTEIWQDREVVSFRCRVPARDAVVINNGRCVLSA